MKSPVPWHRPPSRRPGRLTVLFCVFSVFSVPLWLIPSASAGDWAQWRGPEQNGVSREKDLPEKWSPNPKAADNNLVWRAPYGGRTTPIVMNGRVYLINNVGEGVTEQERVLCFDAADGKVVWEHKFNVFHTDIVSVRVGWTCLAGDPETGNVYAHGVQGLFFCFEGKTGKILWSKSLTEEYGRITGYGGRVTSPVIDGDLVILGMVSASWGEYARGGVRFVAFDKKSGDVVWWTETKMPVKDTYYSNPVVTVINGERVFVSGGGDGAVHAFQVRTGKKLWSYLFGAGAINITPVIEGNYVLIGHGEENLDHGERGRLVCLDAAQVANGKPKLVWEKLGLIFKYPSPILHEGKLYFADEGATLYCFDAKTGKQFWEYSYGNAAKGSPVFADGKIYATTVDGKFVILKPTETGCELLDQKMPRGSKYPIKVEGNGGIAVANGRVFFLTSQDLFCLGKPNPTAKADPIPMPPAEPAPAADAKAAQLQVVPADVVLAPGGSASFKARLFDEHGRFLREAKAEWAAAPFIAPPPVPGQLAGPPPPMLQGKVTPDGTLTVAMVPGQFGGVVAKAEGLEGRARVRVAPTLPYAQDFEKVPENRTPGGWVNAQGKFGVRQLKDGNKVLVKLATNPSPLVSRANAYFTLPDVGDYTIECEILGQKKKDDMPDMGVVNSRYTLFLGGTKQQLRLVSWDALPRIDQTIAFPWKEDVWYMMKLTAEPKGDKALVRGKVWEKGQKEPEKWTVEVEDPAPNLVGSPGLYGYATGGTGPADPGTEIYYDNVKVTPNNKK